MHPESMDLPRRRGLGLWAVALAFTATLAFSTVPTPLYALYQERDGFSTFVITVIFAAYAVGVVVSLFLAGHVSDWLGRRRTLVPAVLLSVLSAIVFLLWRDVPGLLVARFLSGLSVGVVTATATAYLTELHEHPARAQRIATAANLGGLGLGPIVAGVLAATVAAPLTIPFLAFAIVLAVAAVLVALAPETVDRPDPAPAYRPQRVAVPDEARSTFLAAAIGAAAAFAAFGLFTSLAPSFLAGTLHHSSRVLAGVPAFAAFEAAVVAQIAAASWSAQRLTRNGSGFLAAGLVLTVLAVWLPSLALFLIGGVVAGVGAGLVFKGGLMTVSGLAAPERRAEVLAGYFLAGYVGLSVPVLGLGVLDQLLEPKVALLIFAALLLAGVAASARTALGRSPQPVPAT
jgi:MFS family permease